MAMVVGVEMFDGQFIEPPMLNARVSGRQVGPSPSVTCLSGRIGPKSHLSLLRATPRGQSMKKTLCKYLPACLLTLGLALTPALLQAKGHGNDKDKDKHSTK